MKNEKIRKPYVENEYDNYLIKLLESNEFNSIFINGQFGSGKTTMLENAINKLNLGKNECIKFELYGAKVNDNLNYICNELRNTEPRSLIFVKTCFKHTLASTLAIFIVLMSVIYTNTLYSINTIVILKATIIYIVISAIFEYHKTDFHKKRYVRKRINKAKYVIVDDLDREYLNNPVVISLIHDIYSIIMEKKKTKLIMLGHRYKFLEVSDELQRNRYHMLEKYYDYDFELPIDMIKDKQIENLKSEIPDVDYEVEEMDLILDLISSCSTREIIKVKKYLRFTKKEMPELFVKLYLSDYLFIYYYFICKE